MLKKCNKIISAFLALMMLCTLLPVSVFAAGDTAQNEDTSVVTGHTWTVTFEANGGTGEMEPVVVYTERTSYPYVLPSNEFTAPEGMEFAYWTVSGFEGTYQPRDVVNISSDVTVTAHWRPITYYYMVSFDANGGSGEMAPEFIESATPDYKYTVPDCTFTAPAGRSFDYWTDENEGFYLPGDVIELTGSITLIAMWTEASSQNFIEG